MKAPTWFWFVLALCMVVATATFALHQMAAAEAARYQIVPGRDSSADAMFDAHAQRYCYLENDTYFCEDFSVPAVVSRHVRVDTVAPAPIDFRGFDSMTTTH